MKTSVMISSLPLITDPETFFNVDKALSIDVICVNEMPNLTRLKLQISKRVIKFNESFYMPIFMKGSPENLYHKVAKGIPIEIIPGETSAIIWDGKLLDLLAKKKVYDISRYRKVNHMEYLFEYDWLYRTYIQPYEGNIPLKEKSLKYRLDHIGALNDFEQMQQNAT